MKNINCHLSVTLLILTLWAFFVPEAHGAAPLYATQEPDTILRFPFKNDDGTNPYFRNNDLYLKDPENLKTTVEYDPKTNQYVIKKKIGDMDYRIPYYMDYDDYLQYQLDKMMFDYWKERSATAGQDARQGLIPTINIKSEAFDKIFGSNTIDIRPQGSAELKFGILHNNRDDQNLDVRQRKTTSFDFDMKLKLSLMAKIGEKIQFNLNFDNDAMNFELDNEFKLAYEGEEDDILKLIEAGNVTLPLNSSLITGSQKLFGIKTKLQFGRLTLTALVSKQNTTSKTVSSSGGVQNTPFKIKSSEYDENRHFFLSQYFRDNYERALSTLPIITSDVTITKIEVWVTNIGAAVADNRNIIAFTDLGEHDPSNQYLFNKDNILYPDDDRNTLPDVIFSGDTSQLRDISTVFAYLSSIPGADFIEGTDYDKIESARKLKSSEYTFNRVLGFISLNTALTSSQVLAVAYQYTVNGEIYQVGEFSDGGINSPQNLIVKLLRPTSVNTKSPLWDLMMKNVYSLGAYQLSSEDFVLNILYSGNDNGVASGYFNEGPDSIKGVPLLHLLNLDTLDSQLNPIEGGDGLFDFIGSAATSGGTIQTNNGRVFFPVLEPFGSHLHKILPESMAKRYAFDSLYTNTKTVAKQMTEKDKFLLSGYYSSSGGSQISLNTYNIAQGSVVVKAGGMTLTENVDYTVDYTFGTVTILNEGILNSGTTVQCSVESENTTGYENTQHLMGVRADYLANPNLNLGATMLYLHEVPISTKVSYGDEAISNMIWGMDLNYHKEAPFITRMVDALPLISTKATSTMNFSGEFAEFIPGHPKVTGSSGTSYLDDFESAKQTIDISTQSYWLLSSVPSYFPDFNSGERSSGYRRAKMAWYVIDPLFYSTGSSYIPPNVTKDELSNHLVRMVKETELFPKSESSNNVPVNLTVFNVAFYPEERGPYNYNVDGLKADGTLENPENNWGGIMRRMETTDFEANNIEYIEFWLMDPFIDPDGDGPQEPYNTKGGKLVFNLGEISEDILKDGKKSFEHGLPINDEIANVDTTVWGRVPTKQALVTTFDSDYKSRPYQDIGYDGLNSTREGNQGINSDEYSFFKEPYIDKILNRFGEASQAYVNAVNDPSADDFHYFRGSDYDGDDRYSSILERYKNYNGPEGNSCAQELSPETYSTCATTIPNMEDINNDNTLNQTEKFYEYIINLRPDEMEVGKNYITEVYTANNITLTNGDRASVKWYQFKIPVNQPDRNIGQMTDFTSIRFMRMLLSDFSEHVVLRFCEFKLVKGDWRRYTNDLLYPGEYIVDESVSQTQFDVASVSLEENGSDYEIVPYVLPPGIIRERDYSTTNQAQQDETSLSISVNNLVDGDARGTYKNCQFDFRNYKNLQLYVHAHAATPEGNTKLTSLPDGQVTLFIRIGSDFTENYYEYEVPLKITPWRTATSNSDLIWPEENQINISFANLVAVKNERKELMMEEGSNISTALPFSRQDPDNLKNKITILGTPTTSDVEAIMIGIRNPKQTIYSTSDDGEPISVVAWVDELRLTNFNEDAGWAATANFSTTLADLGNIAVSGLYTTPGFGGIATSVSERSQATTANVYTSLNLELGKFMPQDWGVHIPVHVDYSNEVETPEYDPLDPDVYLNDRLAVLKGDDKKAYKNKTQDIVQKTNINFVNVRKDRTAKDTSKPHFWDLENFDVTYSYSKVHESDIDIENYDKIVHTAALGYTYNGEPKNIKPFEKVKFLKGKWFALIRDFNFYYAPKTFTFRTTTDKNYTERLLRNKTDDDVIMKPSVSRLWNWNRIYTLKYDISTALKFDYAATANSYIDEPSGILTDPVYYRQQVWSSIKSLGRLNTFNQTFSVNWTVPISKIPLLSWVSMTAKYDGTVNWTASAASIQERMGNTIQTSANVNITSTMRISKLYEYIPYVNKVVKSGGSRTRQTQQKQKQVKQEADTVKQNNINIAKILGDGALKLIFGLKDVNISYQGTNGMVLPGYTPEPDNFGYTWSKKAPTVGFLLGSQKDIRPVAVANGWLTTDTVNNNQYSQNVTRNITYRGNYEPFTSFKIEITGNYRETSSESEIYKADAQGEFHHYSPVTSGSYQVSYLMISSAFGRKRGGDGSDEYSRFFELLKNYRETVALRYAQQNPNWNGSMAYDSIANGYFPSGYGAVQQEVVTSAFLAAYGGTDPGKIKLTSFPAIPLPNWNFTYNGLSKLPMFKDIFRNVALKHQYKCTYNVANFGNNLYYTSNEGFPSALNDAGNFIPEYEIANIQISEQFSPLIGIDVTMKNSLTASFQFKKSRTLNLSFTNNQLTDNSTNEFVIGLGYRFKDVKFSIRSVTGSGKITNLKSDINVKFDFSMKDNITILRRIDEGINDISAGQKIYSINVTADYQISRNLTLAYYYNQAINRPYLSSSVKNSTLSTGITVKFSLAQ